MAKLAELDELDEELDVKAAMKLGDELLPAAAPSPFNKSKFGPTNSVRSKYYTKLYSLS